ncbi:hypothetical protein GP486_002990 [Trichoglossum hirsutum]|uniref:DUF676 domain-containing protein n=1 Tax=Trichoglossum hirsutum TaxID=265104 RepID=A0A9P8RR78_9PEZI|nr:hypothetical protein GP486_002990 [Trichoglossum hirsutum]
MASWTSKSETQVAATSEYATQGLYGLRICHDAEDAVADIIFIHGITGNRETTWTDNATGIFWPEQFLAGSVPKSRILTFGYDAEAVRLWRTASKNRTGNNAVNLANDLAQLRGRTQTAERPMIFVAHSLGGLVLEDAMLSSNISAEPHIQSLSTHTIGVCFLGTPHCGSQLSNWDDIFDNLESVCSFGVLVPRSEALTKVQQDFHNMLTARNNDPRQARMDITCFYEEWPVTGTSEIVPMQSAVLTSYKSIGIPANHIDMTKFTSPQNAGYLAISSEILHWVCAHILRPPLQPTQPRHEYRVDPTPTRQPLPSPHGEQQYQQQQQQLPTPGWRSDRYSDQLQWSSSSQPLEQYPRQQPSPPRHDNANYPPPSPPPASPKVLKYQQPPSLPREQQYQQQQLPALGQPPGYHPERPQGGSAPQALGYYSRQPQQPSPYYDNQAYPLPPPPPGAHDRQSPQPQPHQPEHRRPAQPYQHRSYQQQSYQQQPYQQQPYQQETYQQQSYQQQPYRQQPYQQQSPHELPSPHYISQTYPSPKPPPPPSPPPSAAHDYETYQSSSYRQAAPVPRVHQGAHTLNIQDQHVSGGGKVVQGLNISSEKDVTLNF